MPVVRHAKAAVVRLKSVKDRIAETWDLWFIESARFHIEELLTYLGSDLSQTCLRSAQRAISLW